MIQFLRRNQQSFIVFTFLYGIVAVIISYIKHPNFSTLSSPFRNPLISGVISNNLLNQNTYLLFTILAILALVFLGFYFTRITLKFLILSSRSQFPALFFLSISAFAISGELFPEAIVSCLFLLLCIERLFDSVGQKGLSYRFFDSGILLGLSCLFYMNMIFLIPFFLLTQIILRQVNWRELLFVLLGVSLPFLYGLILLYLKGYSIAGARDHILQWVLLKRISSGNIYFLSGTGFYLFMLLISSLYALRKFATTKILIRKYYQLLFLLFLNLLCILLFVPSASKELFFLLAIPGSVPLSIYFTNCRSNIVNNLFLLILLAFPIIIYFI